MNELENFTTTELLKYINDTKISHDTLKEEIVNLTLEVDNLGLEINQKLIDLKEIEDNYIILVEEFSKRS
jgi:hypothetical protein